MQSYLVLGKVGRDGIERIIALTQDGKSFDIGLASDSNLTISDVWLTTGTYDIVVRMDADTHADALAFSIALGTALDGTTETLAATQQLDDIFKRAHGHSTNGHSEGSEVLHHRHG